MKSKKFLLLVTMNLLVIIVLGSWFLLRYLAIDGNSVQLIYKPGDVLGMSEDSAQPMTIDMRMGQNAMTISNELFAGAHNPRIEDTQIWEQMDHVGITGLRKDFFIDQSFPKGVSLESYKNNVNNIQDVTNWNQDHINKTLEIYRKANELGWQVTGIVSYSPNWLNVNTNKPHSLPRDMEIYEDLVEKTYRLYRPYLTRVEIWNEPDVDFFLDVGNTGLTNEQAYLQIFLHASRAIRKVDAEAGDGRKIPIGGPVIADSRNNQPLLALLRNEEARGYLNFVSFHDYEQHKNAWRPIIDIVERERLNLPIYVTEWSSTFDIKEPTPEVLSNIGITYTADKIISYANAGVKGANYFALQPIEPDSAWGNVGFLGFYMDNDKSLLPLHKTWQLMSNTLGLGTGEGKMLQSNPVEGVKSMAFTNQAGKRGVVISNSGNSSRLIRVNLENVGNNYIRMYSYAASSDLDGKTQLDSIVLESNSFDLVVPANTVAGVLFEEIPKFQYQFYQFISRWT